MEFSVITPRLYLGSAIETPEDVALLRQHGVTHVVNLACELNDGHLCQDLVVRDFGMIDGFNPFGIGRTQLGGAIDYMCQVLDTEPYAVVYTHCIAGVSRSPSAVMGVLMRQGMSLSEAFHHVRERRGIISPHPAHLDCLRGLFSGSPSINHDGG